MPQIDDIGGGGLRAARRQAREASTSTPLNSSSVGRGGIRVHSGGVITIENGGLKITGTGSLEGSGTFTWIGPINLDGDVGITKTLDVTAGATFRSTLNTVGASAFGGTVDIVGTTRLRAATTLEADLTVENGGKIIVPGAEPMTIGPVDGGNAGISFTSGGRVLAGTGGILLLGADGLARIAASGGAASMSVGTKGVTVSETQTTVQGDINATGDVGGASKSFWIDHPTKPGKQLRHGSLEGPEHGVFYRGVVTFEADGQATFTLPDYFTALVFPDDKPTVQVTAVGRPFLTGAEHVSDGEVVVYGEANREAHVVVFAARGSFDVEPDLVDQSSGITPSLNDSFAAASPMPS